MEVRPNTMTRPSVRAEISSPRAFLAFGALEAIGTVRAWLRRLHKIWNERRKLGAYGGRIATSRPAARSRRRVSVKAAAIIDDTDQSRGNSSSRRPKVQSWLASFYLVASASPNR